MKYLGYLSICLIVCIVIGLIRHTIENSPRNYQCNHFKKGEIVCVKGIPMSVYTHFHEDGIYYLNPLTGGDELAIRIELAEKCN